MKSIKEKEILVNFAKSLGQEVDPALIAEVERYKTIKAQVAESVKQNAFLDLSNAIKEETKVPEDIDYPLPPSLDELMFVLNETIEETKNELVQAQATEDTPVTEETPSNAPGPTLAEQAAKFLSEAPKESFQQPDPLVVPDNMDAIRGKLKFLEQWVSKISMAGPGSGEVNLRYLDDVDRNAIADDKYLRYESNTRKFTFDSGHKNNFHFALQSNVVQRINDSNVASVITYNAVDFQHRFRLESNSRIIAEEPGRYNLQYSIQLENSGAQIESVYIWLLQNGISVPRTTSKYDVLGKHAGSNGAIIAAINYFYETTVANEYVELAWWPTHDDAFLSTIPPIAAVNGSNPEIPETPTVIVTVSPVKIDSN